MTVDVTVYQVVLEGYKGGTDETDHLIKWVASTVGAPSVRFLSLLWGPVMDIEPTELTLDDAGIDLVLTKSHTFRCVTATRVG